MPASLALCILVFLHSDYNYCKLKNLSIYSKIILILTQSLHSPTADLNQELRNSSAPVLTTTSDNQLFVYNEPLGPANLATYDASLNEFYGKPSCTPWNTLGPALQVPADAGEAAEAMNDALRQRPRERFLAPAPTRQETEARDPEPTPEPVRKRRKGVARKGVSGKRQINKVDQACTRCRQVFDFTLQIYARVN